MERSEQTGQAPPVVLAAVWAMVGLVTAGGLYLWAVRGPAIFIDLAGSVGTLLCL